MLVNFHKFISSPTGKLILSIILGLGLASLFRRACLSRDCIVFNAVPFKDIKDKVFKYGKDCYTFSPKAESCSSNKKKVEYA